MPRTAASTANSARLAPAAALLLLAAASCSGPTRVDVDATRNLGGVVVPSDQDQNAVDPRFEAAFQAVLAALEAGDTEVARRLLGIVLARRPTGEALALAERLADVIDGRAVMDACRFELAVALDPLSAVDSRLELVIETDLEEPAQLDLAPLVVSRTVATLDRLGAERWRTDTFLWEEGATLELPERGRTARHVVESAPLPRGEHLAVREQWNVSARSGFVLSGGERLPARAFTIDAPKKEWLASFLDRGPLEPAVFAAFVDDPANDALDRERYTARLLERLLRVPLDRRDELLDHLAERAPTFDDRQLARLFPALRWLAGSSDERDPEQWRRVLAAQIGAGATETDN